MNLKEYLPRFKIPEGLDHDKPHIWIASWFGCGFVSPAPGTWGSLGAIPPGIIICALTGTTGLLWAVLLATIIGLWASQRFDEDIDGHDSKMIVIDEVAGMWIAMIPAGYNPILLIMAFAAFRAFDITKPWPACLFNDEIKGSAGVMGDDLVAGIMAALLVGAVHWLML